MPFKRYLGKTMSLISTEHFKQQPGGLYTAVLPYHKADPAYHGLLGNVLREALRHEAMTHGGAFSETGFDKVLQVLPSGKIMEALFFIVAWDVTKPKLVGASTVIPISTPDGFAKLSEDVILKPRIIRELIAGKPEDKSFPVDGLGACLERETIAYFAANSPALFRLGEVASDNTKIHRILRKHGTVIGTEKDSAVMKVTGPTAAMQNRWPVPFSVYGLTGEDGKPDPTNFLLRWESSTAIFDAIVKDAMSTFVGKSVTRVFFDSKGTLPNVEAIKDITSSAISTAGAEMQERKTGIIGRPTCDRSSYSYPWFNC